MSLQVWLPLTGDLHNQGLNGMTVTNNGATINDNGKIGQCYYFNGNKQWLTLSNSLGDFYNNDWSMCVWLKPTDSTRSVIISEYQGTGASNVAIELTTSRVVRVYWNGTPDINFSTAGALPLDTWTHLTVTKQGVVFKVYFNGILKQTYTYSGTLSTRTSNCQPRIGDDYRGNSASTVSYQGYFNDFRLYDHCLSPKEVEEISKGLLLHYKLDDSLDMNSNHNLIYNGYGDLGTENWTSAVNIYDDVPSGHSEIKKSFINNWTQEFIPYNPNHVYKFEVYMKQSTTSSVNCYPSLVPYDIDKNRIYYYQCQAGYNLDTMTTITQELKAGDTKIYVASLANWNAASGHYYNYAAIFGYADSTGYIYPDGVYTRNTPSFGSGTTEKTNLDKTNNIINLRNAYSGPTIPPGRAVCASTEGSTYTYPVGGINVTTIPDWTYKSGTYPGSTNYKQYTSAAKFLTYYAYSYAYQAGIKLVDLTFDQTQLEDLSGYGHTGTIHGTLVPTVETVKYDMSTIFDGSTYISIVSPTVEAKTLSVWVNWDSIPSYQSVVFLDYKSHLGLGLMSTGVLCITSGLGSGYTFSKAALIANTWYHFVVVNPEGTSSLTRKLYINGIEQTPTTSTSNWTYSVDETQIGKRSTTTDGFIGKMSDVRVYAAALTADQVKDLYNTSATIDNKANGYAREIIEDDTQKITKAGQFYNKEFLEDSSYTTASLVKTTKQLKTNNLYEY